MTAYDEKLIEVLGQRMASIRHLCEFGFINVDADQKEMFLREIYAAAGGDIKTLEYIDFPEDSQNV